MGVGNQLNRQQNPGRTDRRETDFWEIWKGRPAVMEDYGEIR